MAKFAREAEAAGWSVALRAGTVAAADDEASLGVWECEASGRAHDSRQGGESLAVLSLMWTQEDGRKRWTFDTERSGAELGGRILTGYVTLEDFRRALSQARVRQVDPVVEAAETAAREAAERAALETADAAQRAEYATGAAEYARQWEQATDQQTKRFGDWVASSGGVLWLGDFAPAGRMWSATEAEAAEAYAAVMAECRAHREVISRLWLVDRMERGHVPHGGVLAREAAESATREVRRLMSRSAEVEDTQGAAEMIRREVLPAIVSAREAVEAYDAHRSEEARQHSLRAADAGQVRPVIAGPDAVRPAYERAYQGGRAPVAEWAALVGLHRVLAVDRDVTKGHTPVPGCCAHCMRSDAPDMWTVEDGRLLCGQCADTVLPSGWIRGAVRAEQGAPVLYAADVVSDPGGVDAWESEGGFQAGGGRPLLICDGKGGGVFPIAFRGPYEGMVRLSRDVRLRTVRGELAAARDRLESAEFIARERAAWSADMREVDREARRSAGVLGDHVWLGAEQAGDWRTRAYDVALAADRAARNARDAVRALEREESAIVTEQGLAPERVAAGEAHLARLHAGEVQAGRGAWLSEDGEAAMVFTLPWDASHDVEQIPGGVPADQITGYVAFVDVLGDAVAARDERRALTAKDVPGRNRMGGHGPDTDLRRAIVNASKGLDAKPWKAPKVPEAGTPLDVATLATWDSAGDVLAETEAAPGVWLPMAAVGLAEVSMANGWTVAMQRDGGTVAVRVAGTADKRGKPLPYELLAVWVDGLWSEDRSAAWVSGRRVTSERALLWSAPVKVGGSGTHQEPSLLSTVQHKAEPVTLGVRTPGWSAPAPAGVSDPGGMEGWEGEGGALADGEIAPVGDPGVDASATVDDGQILPAATGRNEELPPPAIRDEATSQRAYLFNAGKAGLWVHVTGPRDEHTSAAEHMATSDSIAAFEVASLTPEAADAVLSSHGWERRGAWDSDNSSPVTPAHDPELRTPAEPTPGPTPAPAPPTVETTASSGDRSEKSPDKITKGATVAEQSTGGEPAAMSAQVLAGMPRNAGVLFHEAAERGWDVHAERHWTGRAWTRRIVITGLVMVRKGVEEAEHIAVWSEDKGGFMSSASSAGFKEVRSAVAAQMPVSREAEESGRTVWGRDAAIWVRELNTAGAKITTGLGDVRDAYNALDGTGPVGRRAVEIAGAAYREAAEAERRASDAVKAARAWLANSNGEDARGCAAWRRLIVLATKCVTDAAETVAGAVDRSECEELAAPVIAEAQEQLNEQEAAWRERLATEGSEPTARGYGSLIHMFEDPARDWAAWFDGYTDYHDVAHAPQGDASLSMVAQYDAWGAEKAARSNGRQVSFPLRYTSASNLASDRQDAAAVAFALAVGEHIVAPDDDDVTPVGRGTRALLADIAALRRNPEGFATANERKHLAEWVKHPHGDHYRPRAAGLAEHAPELWEAYDTAARAYAGVDHYRNALVWDRKYAAERAEKIKQADDEGLDGLTAAREARRLSGREEEAWAAAVERFTTARVRVHEASVLAAGDVERAEACGECVRESDALAEDVWSAVGFCREAYDDVHRAKRDADRYAESAEIYRDAGRLEDYVAECVRVEDAAQRAESGREETLNLYGCAFEDATRAEEARQTACTADVAGQVAATVEVIAFHQSPGVVGRIVCQCGAVHEGYFPLRARGLNGEQPSGMADLTDWDIDDALAVRGLAASVDRDQWSRGVLVSSENGTAGFAIRIPVTRDQPAAEAYEASRAARQQATQAAPLEEGVPEDGDDPKAAKEGASTSLPPQDEAARATERERTASLSGTEMAAEQMEQANDIPTEADASAPSGELERQTAAAELAAAGVHASRDDTPQADAVPDGQEAAGDAETDGRGAQLRAALTIGETIVPVTFTDKREPAAGWILTTPGGHTFRLRPVTYSLPEEDQWEAGHDADGSYWWATNIDDRPLSNVLARIREDSATRTRFASLWAQYGHLTAQTPQFETTTDRVQLEEGVLLVRRFGRIGLIAAWRWGWEHLTDPDGAQGHTGEDWSRRGPDHRQYVAEWQIWHMAQDAIPNGRLRVVAQLTDDMADTPDAYCDASAPYVGKCSAKRSGARYTVAVVTDQEVELGRYTVCARCLSHRLLNEKDGRIGHRDVQSLVQALAKGDPKVVNLHWEQWPDRIAEVAGQMLSAALDAGETAPWPAQALTDQIVAEACEAGDDRAKREARAEVKATGGDAKAQKRAAEEAVAARQDRAALVAGQGAAGRAFSARIWAESAGKETVRQLEAGDRAKAEEAAGEASEWASVASEAAEAAIAAGYEPTEISARADMEAANEAACAAVATLGLDGSGVEESDAAPEPAEEAPEVVDVNALAVTPQTRSGEPSTYQFTVIGPGLTVGEYEISHDCQGKGARGIIWQAWWHGVEPSGRWDVMSIGSGEGKDAALVAVAEHAAKAGGDVAAGFAAARRMEYDAGLWLLPDVGESESIQYHPDGSWTITAETGAPYTVRREWQGRTASGGLAPLLIEDQAGALVASCTAVDGYMSAWAPMLERLRLHATAVADGVSHAVAVTHGGPTQEWVEAWCVCGWTERTGVAKYADRAPAGEALVQAHRQAHHQEMSAIDVVAIAELDAEPAPADTKQPPAEGRDHKGEPLRHAWDQPEDFVTLTMPRPLADFLHVEETAAMEDPDTRKALVEASPSRNGGLKVTGPIEVHQALLKWAWMLEGGEGLESDPEDARAYRNYAKRIEQAASQLRNRGTERDAAAPSSVAGGQDNDGTANLTPEEVPQLSGARQIQDSKPPSAAEDGETQGENTSPVEPEMAAGGSETNGDRTSLQFLEAGEGEVPQDTGETEQLGLFGTNLEDSLKPPAPSSSESRTVHRGTLWPGSLVTFTLDDIDEPQIADRKPPSPLTITGHIFPGYQASLGTNGSAILLDAVVRDSAGDEVAAGDIAVQAMPEQVLLTPAGHRKDLYPELRGITAIRVGDLVAEVGARGAAVTAVAYASHPRGATTFFTRDVVTGAENSFTRLHSSGLSVVPRERRLPKDVAPLFGEHTSHDTVLADTQTVLESYQALQEAVALQWPDEGGPQPELRSLHTVMRRLSPEGRGAEAYRSNAEAMTAARNALGPVFAQAGPVARYQGHIGRPLHDLGQQLDIQAQRLSALAAHLEVQAEASGGDDASPVSATDVTQTETAESPAAVATRSGRALKLDGTPKREKEQGALFDLAQPDAPRPVTAPDIAFEQEETATARRVADRLPTDAGGRPNDTEVVTPGSGRDRPNTGEGGSSDADVRDGAIRDDRNHSALNPLGAHASEPLVDEEADSGPSPHPAPTPGDVSPADITAPVEDSGTPVPLARPADTLLRPGRLLHADGTPLFLHQSSPGKAASSHPVTAHGAAPPPFGTGEWQVVLDERGSRMIIHPALISRRDTPRYPGVDDPEEAARWEALDRSEAIGEDGAVLHARHVRPGDHLGVTRSTKGQESTEYLEVKAVRTAGPGVRASRELEFTLAGPRGGARKVTHEPTANVTITHPTAHPAAAAPADGRPITTRLLRELWAEGPQGRQVHNPGTLRLIADGQFALHQLNDRSWELLPATTATVIWPNEYIYGFDGEPPWPLAGFPDADQAKEFAERLTTLLCHGGPGTVDFASPAFPASAETWRAEDGGPLYLALLGERAGFDRSHGRGDSHVSTEYLKFESGMRRPQAAIGHQWADQLESSDQVLLEMDDELRQFEIRSRTISTSGLVTLVLDTDDTVLLARNMTIPSDTTQPITANGPAYADLQAGWAVPEGAWVELEATDLDPELLNSLEHPRLHEPGSRIRAKLSARDDDTYSIRLCQIRLVTAEQERHPLIEDLVIEQPDVLVRLRPSTASAEEPQRLSEGQTAIPGQGPASSDSAPESAGNGHTVVTPADQQAAYDSGAVRPGEDGTAPEGGQPAAPRTTTGQQIATPASSSQRPEPDKHHRAQEIADAAAAATLPEQVRDLWESARSASLPPDTWVDTPDGAKPLLPYLEARGKDLVALAATTDAAPTAEPREPSPDQTPPAAGERPEPDGPDTTQADPTQEAALYELARSALSSEDAPTAPTRLADLDGTTIFHVVSTEPPGETDPRSGSRWLYLGLTDDTTNPSIPIAVISDSDLSRITALDFEHAVSTWAHLAEPVLVNLYGNAAPASDDSQQEWQDHEVEARILQPYGQREADDEHPASASGDADSATARHAAPHHGGTGLSDGPQPAVPATEVPTETDDGGRVTSEPLAREESGSQRQAPVPDRPKPPALREGTLQPVPQPGPAGTEAPQSGLQAPADPTPEPPRTEWALSPEGTNTPADGGAVPEEQDLQASPPTTEDQADGFLDPSEGHIAALRELFEALAALASGADIVSSDAPAVQEAKPVRQGLSTDLTRARADLDAPIGEINNSPRTTPQVRTELGALIAEIDQTLPQLDRIHASQRATFLNRALDLLVRTAEWLRELAARLQAPAASQRIEELTERLRGSRLQPAAPLLAPRGDRRLQIYASTQRLIETQLATPGLPLAQRHSLQEEWILNRARWHNRYKIHHGEPPEGLIPDGSRVAGYPTTPSRRTEVIRELGDHLRRRATDLAAVPATLAQAELLVTVAAAYEPQSPPNLAPQQSPTTPRSHHVADRPDVCAAARRLADETASRAARTAASGASLRTDSRTAIKLSEQQQQAAQPAAAPGGPGRAA
ncbi:hypothetical protein [Streptomyces sp. NPDC059816]|uniref:hypothetical protein n=1 Tax=Streptomyces sp. NPDC059816 TaxID=3346960 RepID=UPI0036573D06